MTRLALAAFAAVSVFSALALAGVPCATGGFVQNVCPSSAPICCSWPESGVNAACCPSGSVCDLDDGTCNVLPSNHSTTAAVAPQSEGGILLGMSAAAAIMTLGAIFIIFSCAGCCTLGYRAFRKYKARRTARLAAERQRLLDESDDEAPPEGTGDEDERVLCQEIKKIVRIRNLKSAPAVIAPPAPTASSNTVEMPVSPRPAGTDLPRVDRVETATLETAPRDMTRSMASAIELEATQQPRGGPAAIEEEPHGASETVAASDASVVVTGEPSVPLALSDRDEPSAASTTR